MKDLRQKLLATFQVEHQDHVRRIRDTLAVIESGGAVAGAELDEAFRRAHSLKGAARAVDLRPIEQLAHRLETLLSRVREGTAVLDAAAAKVMHGALDASEDWMAATRAGTPPPATTAAVNALEALLGLERTAAPAAVTTSAPARPAGETPAPAPPAAPAVETVESLRLNAENLDRIVSSSGQLLVEGLRQQQVSRQLRQVSEHLAETAAERDRVRRAGARVFQTLEASPELAPAARYLNFLDHQVQRISKEVSAARRMHEQNAWTLRTLSSELQRDVRQARMVPAENVFEGFRKMVRDLARGEGKAIDLHITGLQVEADRLVLQALKDPVMHMLRNAISHGLESEAERVQKGKPHQGRIDFAIQAHGNQLTISVDDDGCGVDVAKVTEIAVRKNLLSAADASARSPEDLRRLILLPGFSTAKSVTDLSGRGMGLSVVAETVARLQGKVDIAVSARGGTRVSLSVPLSVSSHRLLLVSCQGQTFAVPVHGIERLHRVTVGDIRTVESKPVVQIDGEPLSVVSLAHVLKIGEAGVSAVHNTLSVMVLRAGTRRLAVAVDAFLSERDAIIKDLPGPAGQNSQIAGGILLEDGAVCLVLNLSDIVEGFRQAANTLVITTPAESSTEAPKKSRTILVVDDSMTTRTLEKSVLEAHGYDVAIAVDGVEALNYLRAEPVGLVITDLQMPRLDGFGLLEEIKRDPRLKSIPVIIVSSLENPEEQARGLSLGADAYIVKRKFEQRELLDAIRQIL